MMSASRERLIALELVRGAAALLVVLDHSLLTAVDKMPSASVNVLLATNIGAFGVHLFFIISGMVMIESHGDDFGKVHPWYGFMAKRVARIFPLYWICTIIYFSKEYLSGNYRGLVNLVLSLLFVPHQEYGEIYGHPVLGLGWTLQYEMAFYLIFCLALIFSRRFGIALIIVVITGSVLAEAAGTFGRNNPISFLSKPIALLFPIGVALGLWRQSGRRLLSLTDSAAMLISLLVMMVVLASSAIGSLDLSSFHLAVAAAIIIGTCSLERRKTAPTKVAQFALLLGSATYAIYLTHSFVIGPAARATTLIGLSPHPYVFAIAMLPIAAATGHLTYRFGERQLIKASARYIGAAPSGHQTSSRQST